MVIVVNGTVDETVSAGTFQIDVTYVGIPIYSKTGSICSDIKCPLAPGAIGLAKTVNLPSFAPSGLYHAQIQTVDSNGALLFCVGVDLSI